MTQVFRQRIEFQSCPHIVLRLGRTQAKLVICRCGSPIEHKAQRIRRRLKYSAGSDDRLSGGRSGRFVRSFPGQRPPVFYRTISGSAENSGEWYGMVLSKLFSRINLRYWARLRCTG